MSVNAAKVSRTFEFGFRRVKECEDFFKTNFLVQLQCNIRIYEAVIY